MERFSGLLLNVWRQVCSHVKLEESLPRIGPMVRERLPAKLIGVLRIDLASQRLDAVTIQEQTKEHPSWPRHRALAEKELESLLTWGRAETVLRASSPSAQREMVELLSCDHKGDLIAGPLGDATGVQGVFIVMADRADAFTAEHEVLVQALREPLTVALHNDQRVTEISKLRDAAEADTLSLLRRLGRDTIVDAIVGAESGLRDVMERVDLVAPSDLPVLILGETGSGKEVVARAIHQRSPRHGGPFLRVNCGAIPPELIDSELFGHEKGSFTGATSLRKGWFERADGGSLFLDEVGELSQGAQVRLLRVLQDGTFERVGGQHSLTVDVRVIAATHPDLQAKVADGRFRQDVWYRIAVFPIELPPLRDRPQDMQAMANHFAQRSARRFGFLALPVPAEDLAVLLSYSWPGNARELAAVIDRAVILGQGKRLEIRKALGMPLGPKGVQNAVTTANGESAAVVAPAMHGAAGADKASLAATRRRDARAHRTRAGFHKRPDRGAAGGRSGPGREPAHAPGAHEQARDRLGEVPRIALTVRRPLLSPSTRRHISP